MPIITSDYQAARWMRNPHLQTVLASKWFKPAQVHADRERLELPDGDFIDINIGRQSGKEPARDIVIMFHGLAGCVQSSYAQGAMDALQKSEFLPILMHWRGCSGEPNRLARSYHSGASDDIGWFINYIAQRYKDARLYALGYSLGANALLKYLGEAGSGTPLRGAMAVSPPLVLQEGANKLGQGFARLYQRHLLKLMREQHERKRALYPNLDIPSATEELNNFWKFDDTVTAPLHGYADADDYYTRCSARQFLPDITIPTRILCARDDPFFTTAILPSNDELAPDTTLELTEHGGHVGFLQGRHRWLDTHVASIFDSFRASL